MLVKTFLLLFRITSLNHINDSLLYSFQAVFSPETVRLTAQSYMFGYEAVTVALRPLDGPYKFHLVHNA